MQEQQQTSSQWRETLTPRQKYDVIVNESRNEPTTSDSIDIGQKPVWFDQKRYDRAQKLVSEIHYASLVVSSFTGLLLIVQVPSVLNALLKTGKSRTVKALMYRYIDTTKHVREWYESKNLFDPEDNGHKSIKLVRAMHKKIFKVMNEAHPKTNGLPDMSNEVADGDSDKSIGRQHLWVNQFDMVLTQFSFLGLIVLYPTKCGAHTATDQDLMDIVYIWRILGYLMGIEDKYNLCTYDNLEDQRELMALILDRFKRILEQERAPVGVAMAEGIALAYEKLLTSSTFNTLDSWWQPEVSLSGNEPKVFTWEEQYKSMVFRFYFNYLFKIRSMLPYVTRMYKARFDKFVADKDKYAKTMVKKYDHLKYE